MKKRTEVPLVGDWVEVTLDNKKITGFIIASEVKHGYCVKPVNPVGTAVWVKAVSLLKDIDEEDFDCLIDIALAIWDEKWFKSLLKRKEAIYGGDKVDKV